MVDLSSTYLGLRLRSPIVASASPITRDALAVRQLVAAGAGAIVHEQVELNRALEAGSEHFAEALEYFPTVNDVADAGRRYLADLERIKAAASDVPVIGSLN